MSRDLKRARQCAETISGIFTEQLPQTRSTSRISMDNSRDVRSAFRDNDAEKDASGREEDFRYAFLLSDIRLHTHVECLPLVARKVLLQSCSVAWNVWSACAHILLHTERAHFSIACPKTYIFARLWGWDAAQS